MTDKEEATLKEFCQSLRDKNTRIIKLLAGMIKQIGKVRIAQLGVELLIQELEKRLKIRRS